MVPFFIIFKKGNPYEKIERSISHSLVVLLEPLHDRQKKKHTRGTEGVRCHRESRTSGEQRDERDRRCTARTEPQTAELRMGTRALQCRDQAKAPIRPRPGSSARSGRARQHAAAAPANHSRLGLGQLQLPHAPVGPSARRWQPGPPTGLRRHWTAPGFVPWARDELMQVNE